MQAYLSKRLYDFWKRSWTQKSSELRLLIGYSFSIFLYNVSNWLQIWPSLLLSGLDTVRLSVLPISHSLK